MRVGIIGGGIAGLTAAYELSKQMHEVTLFEKEKEMGGFASSFNFGGDFIERYYHFICGSDKYLVEFCKQLGLEKNLCWRKANTGYFVRGKLFPFTNPGDLINFGPVSFSSKLKIGLNMVFSRNMKNWRKLDSIPARDWLIKQIGLDAYNEIWNPLLSIKFGKYHDKISAAWIWHRIYRISKSRKGFLSTQVLGCIDKGSKLLVDTLVGEIKKNGGRIHTQTTISKIVEEKGRVRGLEAGKKSWNFDYVISTMPLPELMKLLPGHPDYVNSFNRIVYIGVVCMILKLKKSFTDNFWLNINDERIAVNGMVEYSNLNACKQFRGGSILYIPYYLDTREERYSYTDEQLLKEYSGYLKIINPEFSEDWIEDYKVFRDPYAQPICHKNFLEVVPEHNTPVKNLFLIDSAQMYPADRTLNDAIRLAKKVAGLITK